MTAARTGRADAVQLLLERGADPNRRERWRGQTALMWAAAENHLAAADALIDGGADVSAGSDGGFTPLLFAVRAGYLEMTRKLLAAGAGAGETLPDGTSALVLATKNAHYELGALLLDAGADPNADAQGWTALHEIKWTRRPNLGFNNPPPIVTGSLTDLDFIRLLASHGADLDARMTKEPNNRYRNVLNRIGSTPFLLAAKAADVEMMRLLVELGADPLLPNEDGTTPLMVAAGVGIWAVGESPGTNAEALAATEYALALGGDVTTIDDNGDTALHGAVIRGSEPLVRYLLDTGRTSRRPTRRAGPHCASPRASSTPTPASAGPRWRPSSSRSAPIRRAPPAPTTPSPTGRSTTPRLTCADGAGSGGRVRSRAHSARRKAVGFPAHWFGVAG